MKYPQNIEEIALLKPNYMGFIFYEKSARFIGNQLSKATFQSIPTSTKKVAVFVNESAENIEEIYQMYHFDFIQLHGHETPEFCKKLNNKGINIIKAFAVNEDFDFTILDDFEAYCELFLFDAKGINFGGNGQSFDWNLLQKYHLNTPFFLSGGIGLENIQAALNFKHPLLFGLDLNSRLELNTAIKSVEITEQIFKTIRTNEQYSS
ncbi:MAG: phosphoribosylanthranilate isomerase [Flavobacteriaceae bacterium]|nr:phosphoribosylanthranilate isomerase [Flavobacteriaceae bacterium]